VELLLLFILQQSNTQASSYTLYIYWLWTD